MSSDDPSAEYLDDYFVESDELLSIARKSLLALEISVDQPNLDQAVLEELFRSFHSIKGLSAMVGVHDAEQLAHEMESYLSAVRKDRVRLTGVGLDCLIEGVKTLDEVIAARKQQMPVPAVAALLGQLAALAPQGTVDTRHIPSSTPSSVNLGADRQALLAAALNAGARAWLFTFVPSQERANRAVNVNTIRQRLQGLGELIQAAPLVSAGGQIAFTFVVATRADEETFAPWTADGLTWTLYESPASRDPTVPASLTAPLPELSPGPKRASGSAGPPLATANLVRVELGRLDELMRMVGELVISRARLDDNLKRLGPAVPGLEMQALQETNLALERQLRDLREGVMRVRMVPVREVFARMQFVVRDLTREHRKKAILELSGQETEIDKFVVERMMDPLLHLVRNAVSHGLEPLEERAARGKPPEGRIALRASTTGETITVEVEDDGRGIDAPQVFARARAAGLVAADAPADPAALLDVLCAPGFSTRDEVDRASGRGVGMAVVRTAVEELGGSVTLSTALGQGSRFTIQLPLTLAIADALIVIVEGQRYAVPQVSVREVIQVAPSALTVLENNEIVGYRGGVLPLLRLTRFFHLAATSERGTYALVTGNGANAVGLAVDRVLGLREIVVRPLTDPLVRVTGIAGATELGDGRAVLILDATALARAARQQGKPVRSEQVSPGASFPFGASPN